MVESFAGFLATLTEAVVLSDIDIYGKVLQFSKTLFQTFKSFMTILSLSIGCNFIECPDIANFQRIIAIDSFRPYAVSDVEIETY